MAMDDETIQRITANAIRVALAQDREERDRQNQLATQAAVAAALANQTSQVQALRRPDLPPFDKTDIDAWIRRIEFSYTRNNITKGKDKFAFIEKLFSSKEDPRVNAFLNGDQTDARWTDFLNYLRERYGRTRKQEAQTMMTGIPRDGRRPTDLAALITERTGRVTIDDIRKEMLIREMPTNVKEHLASQIDDLDFEETARECDKHFDMSGKPKHSTNATSVNHVGSRSQQQQPTVAFTTPFAQEDSEPEVSAVRFKGGQRQNFQVANRSVSRGRSSNSSSSNGQRSDSVNHGANRFGNSNNNNNNNDPQKKVCHYHINHGKDAERCQGPWCTFYGTQKGPAHPKGQASR